MGKRRRRTACEEHAGDAGGGRSETGAALRETRAVESHQGTTTPGPRSVAVPAAPQSAAGPPQWAQMLRSATAALILPAVSYLVVYAHEAGYLSVFQIPAIFSTLDVALVVQVLLALLAVVALLCWLAEPMSMLWPDGQRLGVSGLRAAIPAVLVVLGLVLLWIWPENRALAAAFLGGGGLFAFVHYVLPLATQRGRRTYREKLDAADKADAATKGLVDRVAERFGRGVIIGALLIVAVSASSYCLGMYSAQHKVRYLVASLADGREAAVLREYHDRLVCATFDRATKCTRGGFFLVEATSGSIVDVASEQIGPLRPEQDGDALGAPDAGT